jgi:hypothetical protein
MTNVKKMQIALDIIYDIPMLENAKMIACIDRISIPESYNLVRRYVIKHQTMELYDMNMVGPKTYYAVIRNLGEFQIMM